MRPSWDATWMATAIVVAERSRCVRDKVGCVIVDAHNRIVATGYNGPAARFPGKPDSDCSSWCPRGQSGPTEQTVHSYTDCPSLHAEANALIVCDRTMREGGTMYVTSECCFGCSKLIANSGLSVVVWVTHPGQFEYRDVSSSKRLLRSCGIRVRELV